MTDAPPTIERSSAAAPAPPTLPVAPARMTDRDRGVVVLLLLSTFVVILNETTMGVALPSLMADLDIDAAAGQWVTTVFMLTMAVVIPVTGFVLQRVTTRRVFLAAMGLFSVGTLVCALAPTLPALLAGRVVQAGGTAMMLPLLMTTVMQVTPPAARGRTMGNISVVISVAPALGPTLSGLVLRWFEWRSIFVLVLPIALAALALGALRLVDLGTPRYARVDVASVVLSALAFGGLVHGLSGIGEAASGDATVPPWATLLVGVAGLVAFVLRQVRLQRSDAALLDLRTFASPTFRAAVVLMAVSMMSLFGTIILLPLYAQQVLGLEPLATGLLMLPGGLLMGLLAPVVGRWFDRVGPRPLLVPGTALVSASAWGLAALGTGTPAWQLLAVHVLLSAGLALVFTPLFTSALGSLPAPLYSHGSAVVGTVQQVAGAAGTALFVTVLTARSATLTAAGTAATAATAGGLRAAFVTGAVLTLLAVPVAFAVRPVAPVDPAAAPPAH